MGDDRVALILGDNVFYGHGLSAELAEAAARQDGATVFAYYVNEPSQYGVLKFDENENVDRHRRKTSHFYPIGRSLDFISTTTRCSTLPQTCSPSARGELEITDVNRRYLELKKLHVVKLGRGYAWLDTGTHDALLEASDFVRSIQHRQGLLVGCPEEIAYMKGFITADELRGLASRYDKSAYGQYLRRLLDEPESS